MTGSVRGAMPKFRGYRTRSSFWQTHSKTIVLSDVVYRVTTGLNLWSTSIPDTTSTSTDDLLLYPVYDTAIIELGYDAAQDHGWQGVPPHWGMAQP